MRFVIGAILLFAVSFGAVFLLRSSNHPEVPVDIEAVLDAQPEEIAQIYRAFQTIGDEDLDEINRSMLAFGKHENPDTLRHEIGGLMVRSFKNRPDGLSNAGLPVLERISRETLAQIRRYQPHGPDFCDVSIRRDYASAEKILHNDLPDKDAELIIAEIEKARFELAAVTIKAVAESARNPVPVPQVDPDELKKALLAAADDRQDRILQSFGQYELTCDDVETAIVVGLSIPDQNFRHAALAQAIRR
ncbi:MAG TPA: hypothetical protein VKN63_06900 [Afifellaceae bacterium]|nr:hypothetical protein [Afifellaceae bacterium]